jgi:DNA-directed RNA polymerase subunit K/omega
MASHTLSKFELARILGARALQLSFGAPPLLEVLIGQTSIDVSKAELEAGIIPLVVMRQ